MNEQLARDDAEWFGEFDAQKWAEELDRPEVVDALNRALWEAFEQGRGAGRAEAATTAAGREDGPTWRALEVAMKRYLDAESGNRDWMPVQEALWERDRFHAAKAGKPAP